jgi:hypothetical protein
MAPEDTNSLVDMVKVTMVGVNGEWLENMPKLGEEIKLEVVGIVSMAGQEQNEDGQRRKVVKIKALGVRVIGA